MSTCLYAPCYLDGLDPTGTPRLERVSRWLHYYWPLRYRLGFDQIVLLDDGSSEENRRALTEEWLMISNRFNLVMVTLQKLEPTGVASLDYPWCWRALWECRDLSKVFTKIITIDTDGFILTDRLASFVRETDTGWYAFNIPRWNFPSAEFHVLNQDAFPHFWNYTSKPWEDQVGKLMERELPFTRVVTDFKVNRWREVEGGMPADADFASNVSGDTPVHFS
jgi:hypothetical protein